MRIKVDKQPASVTDQVTSRLRSLDLEYGSLVRELEIDKNDLDNLLQKHPGYIASIGERVAELVSIRDGMKDRIKMAEAQAAVDLRRKDERNREKQTEAAYKALVDLDEDRGKAFRLHLDVAREVSRWESLRDAFQERGHALRLLGQLFAAGYWSLNAVKGGAAAYSEAANDDRRKRMAEARDRRK